MKVCSACGIEKPDTDFGFQSRRCRACKSAYAKKYRSSDPEKWKALARKNVLKWYAKNKQLAVARSAAWSKAHPERHKELQAKVREKRKDAIKAYGLKRYAEKRSIVAAANAKWKAANPDRRIAHKAKHRATKLNATPVWANHFFILEAYDLANRRSKITGFKWHVDHAVPLISDKVCGLHCEQNLQVIPAFTNMSKNNRHWPDMWE